MVDTTKFLTFLAIDPGPEDCGVVTLGTDNPLESPPLVIAYCKAMGMDELRDLLERWRGPVVVEWLTCYGSAIGESTLRTAQMCGRIDAWYDGDLEELTRPEAKHLLTQSRSAKTSHVSETIRDIYRRAMPDRLGGGKEPVVGTKADQGPLYGVALSSHTGAALALGLAWLRKNGARW